MANAVKKISVQRGYDVTRYALTCFGGAGGQHACLVADVLGIKTILVHPFAGILSAYGMGLADIKAGRQNSIEQPLTAELCAKLQDLESRIGTELREELVGEGVAPDDIRIRTHLHLRYEGTDTAIEVPFTDSAEMTAHFERIHREQFGFLMPETPLIVEMIDVEAAGGGAGEVETPLPEVDEAPVPVETTRFYSGGEWQEAQVFRRAHLKPGQKVIGPAIILEDIGTIVVEPGWQARVNPYAHIVMTRFQEQAHTEVISRQVDPVMLEVFNNLFMSIAEQMGVRLQKTARSTNIKERLDFSCAVFDSDGELIANAPHTPVHLGSMDRSVKSVMAAHPTMRPGDVFVTNAPYNGGTHLPDITVVTPVFGKDSDLPLFFVASRGHHADVGGIAPGSMTPLATTIDEEGVIIDNVKLVEQGHFLDADIRALLGGGAYPCRNVDQNGRRPQGAGCRQRKGREGTAVNGRNLRPRCRRCLYGPCARLCRGMRPAPDRPSEGRGCRGPFRPGLQDRGQHHCRSGQPFRHHRLHRHQRTAAGQLQRSGTGDTGRRAVRIPLHG